MPLSWSWQQNPAGTFQKILSSLFYSHFWPSNCQGGCSRTTLGNDQVNDLQRKVEDATNVLELNIKKERSFSYKDSTLSSRTEGIWICYIYSTIITFMSGCLYHQPIQEIFDPPAEGHETTHSGTTYDMALNH